MKLKFQILSFILVAIILLGITMPLNPVSNWYQQFLPPINNRPISDITFIDSLTGFAVTPYIANDTAYILKSTNGGNNWNRVFTGPTNSIGGFNRVHFLNSDTGYVCGNFLRKTINGGLNWFPVNTSGIFPENMYVLSTDTIWIIDSDSFAGGVYRTTTGGVIWEQQFSGGTQNPDHIYMYNGRIGFMSRNSSSPNIYRTTNSGVNWNIVVPGEYFWDMHFTDSLTGWKSMSNNSSADTSVKKTTNGGLNWVKQTLPSGGIILTSQITKFSFLNKDTIYGTGGQVFYGAGRFRGMIYRTTNGGSNWLFQLPDTSFGIAGYGFIQFINKNIGWVYSSNSGIHTTTGGDPIWITGIEQISNEVPKEFKLFQNYPNPFNPTTNIKYQIVKNSSNVQLTVYDIQGRKVTELVNQKQTPGTYEVDFNDNNLASGIYFYSLIIDGFVIDTKKMVLIK